MSKPLRLPAALAVAILSAACGSDTPKPDARQADAEPDADPNDCMGFYCEPETGTESCPTCADEVPSCPPGCVLT